MTNNSQPSASDRPADGSPAALHDLLEQLPAELAVPVFRHSSWTAKRSESYERLAFLGDSVLGLAVTTHLFPRLDADRYGPGRLTKIRAQAVSGRSCRAVAERLGGPRSDYERRRRRPRHPAWAPWSAPSGCWPR